MRCGVVERHLEMAQPTTTKKHVVYLQLGTEEGTWVSMAVPSDGSYDTPKDIVYSFPGFGAKN